ncbi:MAG: hypothetical protein JWL65_5895 [Gammaproteobacteria bacterium]|nr:hypothetical protein [Gammaproteobacteria bacterium]
MSNTFVTAVAGGLETDWGKKPQFDDVRAFRRYNTFLRDFARAGEVLVCVLVVAVMGTFIGFLYGGNFENLIFWDGTDHACILDGGTGHINSVD